MHPILFFLLAVVILLLVSGGYIFVMACLGKKDADWLNEDWVRKTPYYVYNEYIQASHRWLKDNNAESVYITSDDGLQLHGFWIPVEDPKGTVLMAHGYRSTMLIDFHLGFELFHRLGYNILVPEQRTHGESKGRFITFGVKESRDMKQWLEYHDSTKGKWPVFLYGISMGASTMLYLADRNLPGNVCGIIADCGFTSPAEIISSVFRRLIRLPGRISLLVADFYARIFAGFGLWEKDSRKTLRRSRYPILLIHGDADGFVPCEMTKQAYEACTSKKKLLVVPGAEHGFSFLMDGYGYTSTIIEFLKENTK